MLSKIKQRAEQVRKDSIWMATRAGTGHLGPALSLAEILAVLYCEIMKYKPNIPDWKERDRFILSKGHGCLALYSILAQVGFFPNNLLHDFCNKNNSFLPGHPERKLSGVEANTGSLGHGIAVGMGMALASKIDNLNYRVFVVTGDGELQEGNNWETAMSAANYKLDNLVIIIDRNRLQLGDFTENISQLEPLASKWISFGWEVRIVDGHNVEELLTTLKQVPFEKGKPSVIIAQTVKGKGLKVAENQIKWHYKVPSKEEYGELKNQLSLEDLDND